MTKSYLPIPLREEKTFLKGLFYFYGYSQAVIKAEISYSIDFYETNKYNNIGFYGSTYLFVAKIGQIKSGLPICIIRK